MNSEPFLWLMEAQNQRLCGLSDKIDTTNKLLRRVIELLEGHCQPSPPPPPSTPWAKPIGERPGVGTMKDMIIYDVNLPALQDRDVVTRELTVIIGDSKTVYTAGAADTVIPGLAAPEDSHVRLELVDIDNKGNRSPEPAVCEFDALDTFAPPKPGDFGVVIVGEDVNPSPCPC